MTETRKLSSEKIYLDERSFAYIKAEEVEGVSGYAIYLADGEPVGWYELRDVAFAAVAQNGLHPLSVH